MFLFLLWPLFARAPRHWFLENFLLSAPGVQSVFFLLRSVGRRDLSAGPEQKKKHHPGCFVFCSGPGERQGKEKPRRAPARGQSKKKNTTQGVFFFALAPCRRPTGLLLPLPFAGAAAKKKHPGWCFFFCSGPVPAPNGASPSRAFRRGRSKKQKYPGWCFFFAAAPRGRSLTHCGPGWRCLPLGGVVFFFCCGPARTGVVLFFLLWPRPDAHSLTIGWGDFGKARVVFCFLLRPRRVF